MTIPEVIYAFYCKFSSATVFEDTYITFYNILFTSIPVCALALFEVDAYPTWENMAIFPYVYHVGKLNKHLNLYKFAGWIASALLHAMILYGVTLLCFIKTPMNSEGYNSDMWSMSVTFFTALILQSGIKLLMFS